MISIKTGQASERIGVKQQIVKSRVLLIMVRDGSLNGNSPAEHGYRVELPRECDAIGVVLRDAYEREMALPDDMYAMLRKISGRPATSRD